MKIIRKACYRIRTVLLATLFCLSGNIQAGGSPETTLVVVNADSPFSKAVANYYRNLRDIPANHVLYLKNVPSGSTLKIDDFRRKILWPIYEYLNDEALFDHIDAITYSADFPYAVDFSADAKRAGLKLNKLTGKIGSLTGLTYFFSQVLQQDPSFMMLLSHGYFREVPPSNRYWQQALTPEEADILKKSLQMRSKKDYEKANKLLGEIAATKPDLHGIYYLKAKNLARMGDLDNALVNFERSIELGLRNRLAASNDRDLQSLSQHPRFTELLNNIKAPPAVLRPTKGFNSTDSWQYIQRLRGYTMQPESSALKPKREASSILSEKYSAPPKLMLSTMLAYTGLRGNGLGEIYNYLKLSAESDGTSPEGTVYLMANNNVRTETRYPVFKSLIRDMRHIHRQVEVNTGILPAHKGDIMGLVTGTELIRWSKSKSHLLPGAIAESLTSYGGDFNNPIQTKLTEFLRQGAAGSSGAVTEPYSFWEKFPSPYLHYHYALGSSLAEAFYQSIASPYQLLIVGDPLTRPYARFTNVVVIEDLEQSSLGGVIDITPITTDLLIFIKSFELWIDGKYHTKIHAGSKFKIDTTQLSDGTHEIRIIAIEDHPLETRSYKKFIISVNNRSQSINLNDRFHTVDYGNEIVLQGNIEGEDSDIRELNLVHDSKLLTTIPVNNRQWRHKLASATLGIGESKIQLHSRHPQFYSSSETLTIVVNPPPQFPPTAESFGGQPGFEVIVTNNEGEDRAFTITNLNGRQDKMIAADDQLVRYRGYLNITESGIYQLTISGAGRYRIRLGLVANRMLNKEFERRLMVPLSLTKGWYEIEIEVLSNVRQVPRVILQGLKGGELMGAPRVRHTSIENTN